jgi:hypothetical protein
LVPPAIATLPSSVFQAVCAAVWVAAKFQFGFSDARLALALAMET